MTVDPYSPFNGPLEPLASGTSGATFSLLEYPKKFAAESGNWITFDRYEYSKASINDPSKAVRSGNNTICLPMPPQLQASYAMEWSNAQLGIAGNQVANAAGAGLDSAIKIAGGGGSLIDAWNVAKDAIGSGGMQYLFNNALDVFTDNDLFQKAGIAAGVARNPYNAIIFQSPNFRRFQFNWRLFPRNKEESDAIKQIYTEFKVGMAPAFLDVAGVNLGNNLFKYPDMWKIDFAYPEHLFKTHFCALTQVQIDYHAENAAIYHNVDGKKRPSSMTLTCDFQEIKVLTREDMEAGY